MNDILYLQPGQKVRQLINIITSRFWPSRMKKKEPVLWKNDCILHHDNAPTLNTVYCKSASGYQKIQLLDLTRQTFFLATFTFFQDWNSRWRVTIYREWMRWKEIVWAKKQMISSSILTMENSYATIEECILKGSKLYSFSNVLMFNKSQFCALLLIKHKYIQFLLLSKQDIV